MDISFLGEVIDFVAKNCVDVENPMKILEEGMPKINLEENEEIKRFAKGLIYVHDIHFSGSSGHFYMFEKYAEAFLEDAEHDDFHDAFAEKYLTDSDFLWNGFGFDLKNQDADKAKEARAVEIINKLKDDDKDALRYYFQKRDY